MGRSSAALSAATVASTPLAEPVAARSRPFLKWAGGKGRLIEQLRPRLPERYGAYFEPFAGGAALFFALGPERASLTDVNAELIDCYCAVRDRVEDVIVALRKHRYGREQYYRVRAQDPARLSLPARAARTIFLNKTGYNGLYRVNRAGKFNVPMGRYTNPTVCDPENLRACSAALQKVDIARRDFAEQASRARAGDFVYFDPPYDPLSPTAAFTSYAAGGFGPDAQRRLAEVFADLARRGVHAVLSNSDTPLVRELYRGFRITPILAARSINSRGSRRGKVGEVVVTSFG
jgi:DNA adenine methylase